MEPAVEVENVHVEFRPYVDRIPTLRKSISRRKRRAPRPVVALDDVTFEVPRGSGLAVIGPNGAGKSTLLRVLAGTLVPDSGRVTIRGKTSTLLQLGAGFNSELSGRKNVFLAGLAAGLTKQEIRERFDDIVAYAELAEAMDRPVKTFSSGMFARLAFAVAMHLKPDILLLDEVLSVGDESFRQKSQGTMQELLDRSGTLVLVTHSLRKAPDLCPHALWLSGGGVVAMGPSEEIVARYLEASRKTRLADSSYRTSDVASNQTEARS